MSDSQNINSKNSPSEAEKASGSNHPVSRSGRFTSGPDAEVSRFTESISFDSRMWREDIQGSTAHARMLESIGILTGEERDAICQGLAEIGRDIEAGSFQWQESLEDVHMNIESALTQRVPAGAKLHTGRSRNDQVAVDTRLWVKGAIREVQREIRNFQRSLMDLAERSGETIIPGYTHLQRAQPVYFAHHLLAYVEMLERDHDRFEDVWKRTNACPLGCGALAGSTLPLDREMTARELGFVDESGEPVLCRNSMDAVSDRDYLIEFCSAASILAIHYSRFCEDVILWASSEFNFIKIADAFTTGSSLMPQKKNPDLAELTRGKTGRVIGSLMTLLTLVKGLPMTYNRDLQEDKEPLFDAFDTVFSSTRILSAMTRAITPKSSQCQAAASDPALLATDLADYLVRKGMPFRKAHHVVGEVVAYSEKEGMALDKIPAEVMASIHSDLEADSLQVFDLKTAIDSRQIPGSPGWVRVQEELQRWKSVLS